MKTEIKQSLAVIALAASLIFCGGAFAEDDKYTRNVSMATILDNEELRAAMAEHVPNLMNDPQIEQARVISLNELAGYVPDQLTDEVIKKILEDMNAAKK